MKEVAFYIIYLGYSILGITGFIRFKVYAYTEQDSWQKVISNHLWIIVFSAIVTGVLLCYMYIRWMPDLYEKVKDRSTLKILAPVLSILLSFILNIGILFQVDFLFSNTNDLMIHGVIMNKRIEKGDKGGREYFLSISDTITKQNYYFEVKRRIFAKYNREDTFNKNFHVSKLGIIYRKEE